MDEIYQCGNCDNEVKYGAKFCDECGTKLEWPKEKVAKVKITNTKRVTKKQKLDVDPIAVEKLCKDCILTIVIIIAGTALNQDWNGKDAWIIPLLLIGSLLGAIEASPIFFLRIGINKWLKSIKNLGSVPEYPTEKMLGRAKGLIIYAAIAGALIVLALIGTLVAPEKPINIFDKTDYSSLKHNAILWGICYLGALSGLAFNAYKVVKSSKSGEKYEYNPTEQQEIESTEDAESTEIIESNDMTNEEDDEEELF